MASTDPEVAVSGDIEGSVKEEEVTELADDTASSSSRSEEDEDSLVDEEDDDEEEMPMPLLSYSRLFGSLPRRQAAVAEDDDTSEAPSHTFSVPATCAAMGQVILAQQASTQSATAGNSPESNADLTRTPEADRRQSSSQYFLPFGDPLLSKQPHYVMAMGYANGAVDLVDASTGMAVVPPQQLRLRESTHHQEEAVIDVSMDSTATFLAAIDTGRMAVIWEFRYSIALQSPSAQSVVSPVQAASSQQQRSPSTPSDSGVFSSFMSALTLGGSTPTIAGVSNVSNTQPSTSPGTTNSGHPSDTNMVPRLATSSIQLSRITYPKSFGVPTCIAIDPSYSRKRDKAVLVGFLDGRLVLTKRGLIFQRRTDAIIYQGTYHNENSHSHRGIEAIEWRGSLAAWADASGIRLFDTDSLTRIAHIDRPAGARASLYPTLSSLRPTLKFETSSYLLVAWGDCLMGLSISDHGRPTNVEESSPSQQQQPPVVRRRTVECAMAWELDCVASGVVPLDSEHVLVVGLVPLTDDDEEVDGSGVGETGQPTNDLEVQIISKADGSIIFSNILPLLQYHDNQTTTTAPSNGVSQAAITESAAEYTLLSSFALPRMEDAVEAEFVEEEPVLEDAFDLQVSLFSPSSQPVRRFVDPHIKWNLNATSFDDLAEKNVSLALEGNIDDDTRSVDSDDYGFIFRPLSTTDEGESSSQLPAATPPLMVVTSRSDAVLARMRDIDEAVAHALESGKSALALKRGLRHKRRLRKFDKNDLVNEYFCSLLRVPRSELGFHNIEEPSGPLSIRRLKLAAKAMPVLFGGEISLWERWIAEVEEIPGALFVLSDHIPVRDPILPKEVYGRVLATMLKEIYQMRSADAANDEEGISAGTTRAEQSFLTLLAGWGPTNFLKEHIKLCKSDGNSRLTNDAIRDAEDRFARRFTQSSAGYLNIPVPREEPTSGPRISSEGYFDAKRSLFDIDELIQLVLTRTPLLAGGDASSTDAAAMRRQNSRVVLDAMAKLHMMKGQYDIALKCLMFIGALHSPRPLSEFKSAAVEFSSSIVGTREVDKPWESGSGIPYSYLLDIVDTHNLQQCVLDQNFLITSASRKLLPIFSLLQLVGFTQMGKFLIEHCVPPQAADSNRNHLAATDEERRGTLPLDLIAGQLENTPRILHWYLHLVFTRKPEVYVRFPNTAYPPRAVTELHRLHFDLYVDFSGQERDSTSALSGVEAYKVSSVETRLLQFLKVTLPLGGIRPRDAKKALESERAKDEEDFSSAFAVELAFIIEHYGEDTESEALEVLDLYMKGARSLVLAVAFAQRSSFSSRLWKSLIEYCLKDEDGCEKSQLDQADGSLFGALLEAAALSGADLAKLVTQIPPGMAIEGLRPRLVAAVADYRLKLKMHEAASEGATQEMISILRELSHRSRRGARYKISSAALKKSPEKAERSDDDAATSRADTSKNVLSKSLRPNERRDRHRLCVPPAIR